MLIITQNGSTISRQSQSRAGHSASLVAESQCRTLWVPGLGLGVDGFLKLVEAPIGSGTSGD
jgi:hypothetical protein